MITIYNKAKCCGCSACEAICPRNCIELKADTEGFFYPNVNITDCINCRKCEQICPINNPYEELPFEQVGYIVQNKNEQILRESTSGGAFTSIAKYVIQNKGIVFGVALTDKLMAHHVWVDNVDALTIFRNSKYIQSYMGDTYNKVKSFLNQDRLVCFSGTPCQVEGLMHFLGKEYNNLITVDVVCRAVPSPMVFGKYLDFQRKRMGDEIKTVRFRDKFYGYKYSTLNIITDKNNKNYHQGVETDSWLRAFFSGICNRPSCYECQFKKRYRKSDFTIWDCFNVGRFSKELDNDKGATRLLIHTNKGNQIFQNIENTFQYIQIQPTKLIDGTAEMIKPVKYNNKRSDFMQDAAILESEALFNKYFPKTLKVKVEHSIRMMCYRLGVYSILKKAYVKITHKY